MPECIGRRGEMMKHHVQYYAVGLQAHAIQGIGQLQADVSQGLAFTHLARQFEHGRAVVQRRDPAEASRQVRQECAIAGADFDRRGRGFEA
ncbi:hypothetical protein D9M68_951530 [compost metagenome]